MFPALHAKKVLLGISGSIAAYKTPFLVRALIKACAEVQVVMTPASKSFVAPLSLSTVSNKPVYSEFVESEDDLWNNHVDLGLWADLMLIAPASANTLSKMSQIFASIKSRFLSLLHSVVSCVGLSLFQGPF